MELTHYDKQFEEVCYTEKTIRGREFESCTFKKCDFSNSDFGLNMFMDCIFTECNLTMMKLGDSILNNVTFNNCKIMGVNFSACQDAMFSVKYESCLLDYSSFMGKKMPKTRFISCSLKEVNFAQSILTACGFENSDLLGASFNKTDLGSANFATAVNYTLDPELNNIQKGKFSADGLSGLLTKYKIKIV